MKEIFKESDFDINFFFEKDISPNQMAADQANKKLEKLIRSWAVTHNDGSKESLVNYIFQEKKIR